MPHVTHALNFLYIDSQVPPQLSKVYNTYGGSAK